MLEIVALQRQLADERSKVAALETQVAELEAQRQDLVQRNSRLEKAARKLRATIKLLRSELKLMEEHARVDPLTGAGTRAAFEGFRKTRRARRYDLLYFDLDRFKRTNDTYGHAVGDRLLIFFGFCVTRCIEYHGLSPREVFYRMGGDEFAVFVPPELKRHLKVQIKALFESVELRQDPDFREAISRTFDLREFADLPATTVSIGESHTAGGTVQQKLNEADTDMYRQKAGARRS